ncbi:Hypothetical predicted protein, partial [Cloeon dipterum]
MAWVNFHPDFPEDIGVISGHNQSELPIFVARTYYKCHFIPGYAVNGVGYFVSVDLQPI